MTDKLITKEEADAADAYLDEHNSHAWIQVGGNNEVQLDGWFTIDDLERIILLKRYKDQQEKLTHESC